MLYTQIFKTEHRVEEKNGKHLVFYNFCTFDENLRVVLLRNKNR